MGSSWLLNGCLIRTMWRWSEWIGTTTGHGHTSSTRGIIANGKTMVANAAYARWSECHARINGMQADGVGINVARCVN